MKKAICRNGVKQLLVRLSIDWSEILLVMIVRKNKPIACNLVE